MSQKEEMSNYSEYISIMQSTTSSQARPTIENTEEEVEDCKCDANLFYKKYKSKIEEMMEQHLAEQKAFLVQQKRDTRQMEARKQSHLNTSGKPSGKKGKGSKGAKGMTLEVEVETIKVEQDSFKKQDTYSIEQTPSKTTKSEITQQEKLELADTASRSQASDLKTLVSIKVEDDIQSQSTGKDVQQEHLSFYQSALDAKLQQLFSEPEVEEESYSERGYFIFDRFVDRSEQSTVCKLSSLSASGEGVEEDYTFPPSQPLEEWMSESMRRALEYLKRHRIGDLFKFLGAHLVSANPCNPIEYLINLLENCLNYRMGFCDPPLLYLPKHIESLFNSMDPMGTGYIEMNQYHTGMFTLGIREYNMFPETLENMVPKHSFLNEAFNQLRIQLNDMIRSSETPPSTVTTFTPFYSIRGG